MDRDTQILLERAKQRRQQLNDEIKSIGKENNLTGSSAVKRKQNDSRDDSTPAKKSSFNENDLARKTEITTVVETVIENVNLKAGDNFYPLHELEEMAKTATHTENGEIPRQNKRPYAEKKDNGLHVFDTASIRSSISHTDTESVHGAVWQENRKARLAALAAQIDCYSEEEPINKMKHARSNDELSLPESSGSDEPTINRTIPLVVHSSSVDDVTVHARPIDIKSKFSNLASIRSNFDDKESVKPDKKPPTVAPKPLMGLGKISSPSKPTNHHSPMKKAANESPLKPSRLDKIVNNSPSQQRNSKITENERRLAVSKLRDRWEMTAKTGKALHPENSFSEHDEITSTAMRVFAPVVSKPIPTKRTAKESETERKMIENDLKKVQNAAKYNTNFPEETKVVLFEKPKKPSLIKPPRRPAVCLDSSIEIYSYTEDTVGDETTLSNDPEFETCLDEAIEAATQHANAASYNESEKLASDSPGTHLMNQSKPSLTMTNASPIVTTPNVSNNSIISATSLASSTTNSNNGLTGSQKIVHTVSAYRRLQKKHDAESTPVRTVVRPPSSPGDKSVAGGGASGTRLAHDDASAVFIRAKEYDEKMKKLNEKIKIEQEHILQASRALSYCLSNQDFHGSVEEADAHKVLRIAIEKRKAYQEQLDRLNIYRRQHRPLTHTSEPLGTLTFSYIGLTLKRDFINSRVNDIGDYVYYFFCLIKCDDQIIHTQSVSSDLALSAGGRVEFPNYVSVKNVTHDFSVEICVFALQCQREESPKEHSLFSKANTLRNKFRPLSSSTSSYLTTNTSLGGPGSIMESKFKLAGQANVTLNTISQQNFVLQGFQYVAPIEASINLKMRCFAETMGDVELTGFLNVHQNISGLASWRRLWCKLSDGLLRFWAYPDEQEIKEPVEVIDLTRCATQYVEPVNLEMCTRPNTFMLEVQYSKNLERRLFSTDNREDFSLWSENLNKTLHNLHLWNEEGNSRKK